MIIKKGKCLDDNQVAQFVDGCLTFVMNFISDNPELCKELNDSYNAMAHRSLK